MYQGTEHYMRDRFDRVADLMDRYTDDGARGARPAEEYRAALRNSARLSYRIAKKAIKQQIAEGK
jgi:hypothetical protein